MQHHTRAQRPRITRRSRTIWRTATAAALCALLAVACGDSTGNPSVVDNNPTTSDPNNPSLNDPGNPVVDDTDTDGDGVPDVRDNCDSAPGDEVGVYGCPRNELPAEAPDTDGDGVPDDRDICAETSAGDAGPDGCAPGQSFDDADPNDPLAGELDFLVFTVDPTGGFPITLRARADYVIETGEGFEVDGTLLIETPLGHVALAEANVLLATVNGDPTQIDRLVGTTRIPFPEVGVLEGIDISDLAFAQIGLDYGSNLEHLEAPLQADRRYFVFSLQTGLEASLGPVTMASPGNDIIFVFDPWDPMFFTSGDIFGLAGLNAVENVGFGVSAQGMLAFNPLRQPMGASDDVGPFDGHIYLRGTVPLRKIPVAITGEGVVDIDPDHDGITAFNPLNAELPDLQVGVNGTVALSVDFLRFFNFGFDLGEATAVARLSDNGSWAYISGTQDPDLSWLPPFVPVGPTRTTTVEAYISDDIYESYIYADSTYAMDLTGLGELIGVELGELYGLEGSIYMSAAEGIVIEGVAHADFPAPIALDGDVLVEARFNDDIDDWSISLTGDLEIGGVDLNAGASLLITSQGVSISGVLDTAVAQALMSGALDANGFELTGSVDVGFDITAAKDIIETIACGYEWVTDGAICGFEYVTDAAVCGFETVTNGAICGYETVTDAAVCGWDAVNCGWRTFTDAVSCGWNEICNVFGDCGSCEVYVCDEVPATCTDFNRPASCQVAASCYDINQPKSCQDLDSPTYCEENVTVPDFDWGSVQGSANLRIGTSGLSGSLTGSYCLPDGGGCISLPSPRLSFGNPMEACVTVDGLGEFCAPF